MAPEQARKAWDDQGDGNRLIPLPRALLVINTYAGSLLVAAKRAGNPVLVSLEDHGYGAKTQRLNFPGLSVIDEKPWPEPGASMQNSICIAHPPCACFSVQGANADPIKRGLNSEHFKSTKAAIEYAMELDVAAIAVESVVPTMRGAWSYHEEISRKYEYNVFRVLQNAITFGLPQWRPRFWCIFIRRRGAVSQTFIVHHRPEYRTIGEALQGVTPGDAMWYVSHGFDLYTRKLSEHGIKLTDVLETGVGSVPYLVAKYMKFADEANMTKNQAEYEAAHRYNFTTFSSAWPLQLDPGGFSPTLMATSHWYYNGRPLTIPEYNVIAGFPADYKFDRPREITAYLSRGIAPPVGEWILGEIERNLDGELPIQQAYTDMVAILKPDDVADFRVRRGDLKQRKLFNLHRRDDEELSYAT